MALRNKLLYTTKKVSLLRDIPSKIHCKRLTTISTISRKLSKCSSNQLKILLAYHPKQDRLRLA